MKKKNKFQVFCVIGKSGSGKGTQVELLKKKFKDVFHIVLGDLLRAFIKQDNRIARTVGAKMNKGELAPDWLADYLWQKEFMKRAGKVRFVIFEGNPRTIKQAEELEEQQNELMQTNEELQTKTDLLQRSEATLKVQQEELQQAPAFNPADLQKV